MNGHPKRHFFGVRGQSEAATPLWIAQERGIGQQNLEMQIQSAVALRAAGALQSLSLEIETAIENNRREIPRAKFEEPALAAGAAHIGSPARDAVQCHRSTNRRYSFSRSLRRFGGNWHRGAFAWRRARHLRRSLAKDVRPG